MMDSPQLTEESQQVLGDLSQSIQDYYESKKLNAKLAMALTQEKETGNQLRDLLDTKQKAIDRAYWLLEAGLNSGNCKELGRAALAAKNKLGEAL